LSLSAPVVTLCRSGYYHYRQVRVDIRSLTEDAAKTFVQAFITRRLDDSNSLLMACPTIWCERCNLYIQNAAPRLVTWNSA